MTAAILQPKTVTQIATDDTYTFASQPRALFQPCGARGRNRFRDVSGLPGKFGEPTVQYGNIMYDRRVVRGSTVAQQHHTVTVGTPLDRFEVQKQFAVRRRVIGRRPIKQPLRTIMSPPPVPGRQHIEVQTEFFLEELSATVEVLDEESQTDSFLDRPATPLFVSAKTGLDAETQILEGELFNFDYEVTPLIEVMVGKTVEQSLLEVLQEEELASLREQQHRFEEIRNAQLAEQQRLEEQERRFREEKNRRLKQHKEALMVQQETTSKAAAFAFTQNYLTDLAPSVFQSLKDSKFFYDPVEKDLEQMFMPWLMNQVVSELNKTLVYRAIIDGIISDYVQAGAQTYVPMIVDTSSTVDGDYEEISGLEDALKTPDAVYETTLEEQDVEIFPEAEEECEEEGGEITGEEG